MSKMIESQDLTDDENSNPIIKLLMHLRKQIKNAEVINVYEKSLQWLLTLS